MTLTATVVNQANSSLNAGYGGPDTVDFTVNGAGVAGCAAVALTIPLCAALALIARARWQNTAKLLATVGGR